MAIALTVNGRAHTVDVDPATPLLYVLSDDLALRRPEVRLRPRPVRRLHGDRQAAARSARASRRSARVDGAEITTLEGLGTRRAAASDSAGVHRRAGGAVRLLPERRHPDGQGVPRSEPEGRATPQIQQAMSGVLCRCFAHTRMLRAIKRYARRRAMTRDAATRSTRGLAPRLPEDAPARWSSASARAALPSASASRAGAVRHARVARRSAAARLVDRDRRRRHASRRTPASASSARASTRRRRSWSPRSCRVPLDRVTLIQCDTAVCARSGHDVGQPVDPTNFNEAQPGAGRRDRARGAAAARRPTRLGVPVDQLDGRRRRRQRAERSRRSGSATASSSAARSSTCR